MTARAALVALVLAACSAPGHAASAAASGLPDPTMTPGAVVAGVAAGTVCRRGYAASVRPPVAYTEALKRRQMAAYHRSGRISAYAEDHLVPLELGGDPRSPANLWPEPRAGAPEAVAGQGSTDKDRVEGLARSAVCNGRMPLADAQRAMADDWVALGRRLG